MAPKNKKKGGSCCDCAPGPSGFRRDLYNLVNAAWFGHVSTGLVLVNMALMCMPYADMTEEYAAQLENAATVISLIFMAEMNMKLVGCGCSAYWADGWNKLDGSIVIMSYVDLAATILASGGANLSFLRILRMLRVLRILRLMRNWKGLFKVVTTLYKALPQMANMIVLMLVVVTICALLGMQLFGGQFSEEAGYAPHGSFCPGGHCPDGLNEIPRYHFDYFGPAMITSFVLMTGSWISPLGATLEVGLPDISSNARQEQTAATAAAATFKAAP